MTTFDHDAFISYAHLDNEPLTVGQKGWVSQFHATLQTMLSQRLGARARIWRDEKLAGNDVFADEIVDQFARTALLVSILSPRYVRSEWCTRELNGFCEAAARHGGLTVGNKSRVIKVVKTPVGEQALLPEAIRRTLGYEFFALEDGDVQELDPAYGDEARQRFLRKLSGLAWELSESLQRIADAAGPAAPAAAGPALPTVFLADCGRDLRDAREDLATDLRMHGYEVLPVDQRAVVEDTLVPELEAQLARAALSIHLVGASVGPIPDGRDGRSLVALENALAAERSRAAGLTRIVWLPDGVKGERPEQQALIDAMQRDAGLQYGADLLRGDLESLKGAIHATLRRLREPVTPPVASASLRTEKRTVVHVLMTEGDRPASVALLKLLRAEGLTVSTPVFTGSAAALREANAQLLAEADAVLLYYGEGDEVWKFHQQGDLRKQPAAGRSEWLCLAAPSTADKALLAALGEAHVVDLRAGPGIESLAPVMAALATR